MRILITGGTGFAGSQLANLLAEESHDLDLYGTYRHSGRNTLLEISRKVKLLECDINYFQSVERVLVGRAGAPCIITAELAKYLKEAFRG